MGTADKQLGDKNILVTRPAGLHDNLCAQLNAVGANAIHYAAIEITSPADSSSREYARDHFDEFDIAIFISPTAVRAGLEFISINTATCQLAAIGSRSQAALEQAGLDVAIKPEGHDSESLLRHAALQQQTVTGKNIIIFRGEDGRDILGDELKRRGAQVHYAAMYARIRPAHERAFDTAFIQCLHAITISSNESLQNLYDMAVDAAADISCLLSVPLFVPGKRAFKLAQSLGFSNIVIADNATDDAMLAALSGAFERV
jgi:uroporphyrinogen-III synthase